MPHTTRMLGIPLGLLTLANGARAQSATCSTLPPAATVGPVDVQLGIRLPYSQATPSPERRSLSERQHGDARQRAAMLALLGRVRADLPPLSALQAPSGADLATRFTLVDSAPRQLAPDIGTSVTIIVTRTGEIVGIETGTPSMHRGADSALLATARRASGSTELVSLASLLSTERSRLSLYTTFRRSGDPRAWTGMLVPWDSVSLPLFDGTPVTLLPGAAGPTYPQSARESGQQGEVLMQFTVSAIGIVEPGSLRVVDATAPVFADAASAWIPTLRYKASTIGGCAVRALVQQPTRFTLHR